VTRIDPLSSSEEVLWRAMMRIVKVMPRVLDGDLISGAGLSASEYTTLMHLSEAPESELRMADLAGATGLSASRMTRLIDGLQSSGLVTKTASSVDARGNIAKLTRRGEAKLRSAWPVHLESVRNHFFNAVDEEALEGLAIVMTRVADGLDDRSDEKRVRVEGPRPPILRI
jgi:DNA-binding MarR family transcriptional regulator